MYQVRHCLRLYYDAGQQNVKKANKLFENSEPQILGKGTNKLKSHSQIPRNLTAD